MWYSWTLCSGLYPYPFRVKEVTTGGVASNALYDNPSTSNTSLLYLNVIVNDKKLKVMLATGASRTFISVTALHPSNSKQFVNKSYKRVILADGYTSLSILGTWD